MNDLTLKTFSLAANSRPVGLFLARLGLIIVLIWIGALKIYKYEADGIVPFVANSPFMSFFYKHPAPEYKKHVNPEGALVRPIALGMRRTTPTPSLWVWAR